MSAHTSRAGGFSLVEALVALSLIGLASSTLLLATASTVQSGSDATVQTIARGIADQIIDEVVGLPYCERGSSPSGTLGPEAGETATPARRALFDDSDDYAGYSSSPPRDPWGVELGQGNGSGGYRTENFRLPDNFFSDWNVQVSISYVDENDPSRDLSGSSTSVVRAVRVQITRTWSGGVQELASVRRVIAYVPAIQSP